jgi:membrane protease subunit (stomatin/prohibitin family)
MGIFDFVAKQFIDVIDWTEPEAGILAYRYPMSGMEIQNGAKLTVRDSQMALFVNEGKIADLFGPGLYTLNTQTLPILTYLQNWDKFFESPFKSDVYYFSTRLQLDQKWGTATPITVRDKEYGPIRIRANGVYSYKIEDPKTFYQKLSGTTEIYRTEECEGQLRALVLTYLADTFGKAEVPFVDMAGNQLKLSEMLQAGLQSSFTDYGLKLDKFQLQSISLPEELQKRLDERASMNIVGDMRNYTQFQAATSIPLAAQNEGGLGGAGAGLGAGLAMGQAMMGAMGQAFPGAPMGTPQGATPQVSAPQEDALLQIEKLHDLLKKGILSQAEFDAKKAELLKRVG